MKRLSLVIMLLVSPLLSQAELVIRVTEGRADAVSIAIPPFAGASDAPENVGDIIEANLHRTGVFKPIPPGDMLSHPSGPGDMHFRDFRVLGVEYVVAGKVSATSSGGYEVSYALFDVGREAIMLEERYRPPASQLRDVAHAISDRIYEELTGTRGVFSTKLLYVTHDPDNRQPFQLHYADADGHRVRTILRSDQPIMSPSWSPDGRRVAYVSFEDDGRPGIYVHTLATAERQRVTSFPGINGAPSWSPDGHRLAFTLSKDGNPEIYMKDLRNDRLTRLTQHPAIDTEPRWLDDGEHIVFTSGRSGGPQIYQLNINDRSVRRLSFEGTYNARPDVTPDGRYLVYVHRMRGSFNIAVQDLQRGTFDVVSQTDLDESPSVAPNGSMIIYGTRHQGKGVLEAISIDGRVRVRLPAKSGEVREPAWSPFL